MQSLDKPFRALVVGSTGGLGRAFVTKLEAEAECAEVVGLSRENGLDLSDEGSIRAAAETLAQREFDLVIVATGALMLDGHEPEKTIRHIQAPAMAAQFAVNAIGPALLLKHFAPRLPRGRRSVFAVLSARVGSIGDNRLGGWISYRAAKAALNQILHTSAIEIARTHPQAVLAALHPGTVDTRLSDPFASDRPRFSVEDAATRLLNVLDGLAPEQSGQFFAYDGEQIPW